ncbi:helix-turn-helix domain-containing protein [Rhodobacteraceae bacterium CCMM004]|nr:helix-turn-helix domain-containing protein [Rhodobacteraceae bacterium CCMM004]
MIGRFRQAETEATEEPKGFDDFDMRLGDIMRGERATLGKSLLDVQRELKIKATYIAAIENADPSAFETPGFIAGYVRSYARYLDLDPEWAYKAFCAESNFETAHGMSQAASAKRNDPSRKDAAPRDPFADSAFGLAPRTDGFFSRIEPGAIGSLAVLTGLIGLIGYGGYAVLNEVQKVQFVPVDQAPGVVANLDPLEAARSTPPEAPQRSGVATAEPDRFDRLYRPQALEVPVLVARDGPISTIDPRTQSALAAATPVPDTPRISAETGEGTQTSAAAPDLMPFGPPAVDADGRVQVVEAQAPEVVLLAVRPSWVRVRAADGTVLLEKIMQEGDRFVLPQTEEPATLRTGESGAIYFAVNGEPYGPAGRNGAVTSNLALSATNLTESYQVADLSGDTALARVVAELDLTAPAAPAD